VSAQADASSSAVRQETASTIKFDPTTSSGEKTRANGPAQAGLKEAPAELPGGARRAHDPGALALALVLRFHRIAADPEKILHEFAAYGRLDAEAMIRAARGFGVKARRARVAADRLQRITLPAIAETRDGGFVVIGAASAEKVLVQVPGQRPEALAIEEFVERSTGWLVLLTPRANLAGETRRFDFSWFIPSVVKYRRMFGEVLAASLFLQVFGLVTPLLFQVVIDKVLVHRSLTTLDVLVIGLIGITLFEIILGSLRTYIFSHTTSRVDVELGARLFRHLLALPIAYFESRQVGQTVARVRELENIRSFLTGSALTVVLDLLFVFVFLGVMYHFSPTLTWIVLGAIPFYVVLSLIVTPVLRRRIEEKFQRGAAVQSFLVETVSGIETLKAAAVEPQMRQRWDEQLAGYVRASFRTIVLGTVGSQGAHLINKVVTALILWVGAQAVIDNSMTVGQLVAFNMLAGQVNQPILRLAQLWQDFQQFRISLDRLGDVLNSPPEPSQAANRPSLPKINGAIAFDGITFRYRPDTPEVLRRLSLSIQTGQVVGIVGRSGSGKSTLAKLVQRLYAPESGRILVDGVDLALVDPAWLRRQIGVVLQENVLFNRSIRDNIALADPAMAMERVVRAAQLAGAHEFILSLPHGYDTVLGERGSSLSGGQRQRVAIARALVTEPRILIFDEATSALDYESERIIQDNMREICKGRTVLVIAHRLSTVRGADRIVTIENGQIIEDGTHAELLTRGGRYAELHKLQSGAP